VPPTSPVSMIFILPQPQSWSARSHRGIQWPSMPVIRGTALSRQWTDPCHGRFNPEMSNQIQDGLQHMNINARAYSELPGSQPAYNANDAPHLSPFPRLVNPPPNVPPSDEELEATLERARTQVLNSNDPDMQLAWAADTLVYVGVCADNEERIAAAKPQAARSKTPRIEHQLKTDAMNIVTFLADQHHPRAEFLRGMWLEWGRFGQREDKKEAFRCYSRAADRGFARAEYRIGMLYESYNDPIKALRHYHRGVDVGDAASCYRLGMMTLRGQHGQQQDYAKGLDLIRKSAEKADENAAQGSYVYGMLLSRQLPQIEVPDGYLPYDEQQAKVFIEKAAYLKFAKAQLKMGSAYELGSLGCEFNPALSMHYNALASKQGEAEADMALSKWFLVGSEGLFPKNEELAYTYAERAAQASLPTAEFAMGYFHEIGMYVPVDLDKALEWYQKAAKHGNDDAKGRIDGLSRKQVLSRRDHENVAINRIKSQYGSQRGQRPERFRHAQKPSETSIAEEGGYGNNYPPQNRLSGTALSGNNAAFPPRGDSTTPYPMNDGPPAVAPDHRSASVAPYPLENGPPGPERLPPGGYYNSQPPRPATTVGPDMRPSSAFQLNPDMRSSSAATIPQLPSQGGPPRPPYGPGYPPSSSAPNSRPMTAQPGMPPYGGPGGPGGPGPRPGPGQRVASGPAGAQNFPPNGGPPQPRPGMIQHHPTGPPGPGMGPPPRMGSAGPPQQGPGGGPPQRLDIGFSAPPDDHRRKYGPQPGMGGPAPGGRPPVSPTGGHPGLPKSDSMPIFNNPTQPGRASAPNSRPHSRPPENRTPAPGGAPKPPAPSPAPAAAAAPAKKGPKTFDEMGVPAQKKGDDCVRLPSHLRFSQSPVLILKKQVVM
jgi:TPR repeat protein